MKNPLIGGARFHQQFISPGLPARYHYYLTCSQHMIDTVHTHGSVKRTTMGVTRILQCYPFIKGSIGYAPLRFRLTKNPDEIYRRPYTYRRNKKTEVKKDE